MKPSGLMRLGMRRDGYQAIIPTARSADSSSRSFRSTSWAPSASTSAATRPCRSIAWFRARHQGRHCRHLDTAVEYGRDGGHCRGSLNFPSETFFVTDPRLCATGCGADRSCFAAETTSAQHFRGWCHGRDASETSSRKPAEERASPQRC
jgi:hypothetical protein